MQTRGRNAILLFLFLVLLVVRLASAVGDPLHFDEPGWLIRGDFLVGAVLEGDWNSLQEEHWTVVRSDGHRRLFRRLEIIFLRNLHWPNQIRYRELIAWPCGE